VSAPDEKPDAPRQQALKTTMSEDVAQGQYSNLATIISSPTEFFVDFGTVVPGRQEFHVFSRVILSPAHAKQLSRAMAHHVAGFERAHGPIALPGNPPRAEGGGIH
jgi:hypothetical protein